MYICTYTHVYMCIYIYTPPYHLTDKPASTAYTAPGTLEARKPPVLALPGRYPPDFTSFPPIQPLIAGPPSEPHRVLMAALSRRRRHVGRTGPRQPMSL